MTRGGVGDLVDNLVARASKLLQAPAAARALALLVLRDERGVDVGNVLVGDDLGQVPAERAVSSRKIVDLFRW